jgi:signal transduction histidine kinase
MLSSIDSPRLAVYISSSSTVPSWFTSDHALFTQINQWSSSDLIIGDAPSLSAFKEEERSQMLVLLTEHDEGLDSTIVDDVISNTASFADQMRLFRRASIWKERNQLRIQLSASKQRVDALEVGSKALSELHDVAQIFQRLVEIVAHELHSERVSILRVFSERGELQMIAAHGIPAEIVAKARPKIGEGIAGRCAAMGEPIFVSNHKEYRDSSGGQVSGEEAMNGVKELPMSLTVPILVKGEVLGVVNVTSRIGEQPYSIEEIAFLSALMSHAGYLMESARLIDSLSSLQAFSERVINTIADPLVVVDGSGKILKMNARFVKVFDTPDHLQGLTSSDTEEAIIDHLKRGVSGAFPNITRNEFTFDIRLTPFDEENPRALILFQDVTDRQRMGKQLVSAEKMASLGILAAGVAHEINNPLGFVKTNTKEAGRYFEDLFEIIDAWDQYAQTHALPANIRPKQVGEEVGLEEVREDVPNLIRESLEGLDRIQKITASLKSFAHPDTENTREAQLSILVENALVITQSKWKHILEIERDVPQHGDLSCIPSQLEQVFMNLVVNAAQAAKGKGITSKMRIYTSNDDDPRKVQIRFEDQCGGIPHEVVERIFDPFFTTKDIGEGTGLGLHIAHNIIEGHGGTIEVDSQLSVGTTFIITLPLGVKKGPMVIKQLSRFKI